MVDKHLLEMVEQINPNQLKGIIEAPFPAAVLLIEFDDPSDRAQKPTGQEDAENPREILPDHRPGNRSAAAGKTLEDPPRFGDDHHPTQATKKALPIIEDGIVPIDKFKEYIDRRL
jgi:hypothetical protein